MSSGDHTVLRRDELAERLAAVRQRISRAAVASGRDRDNVRLVVVTKTFPASDVCLLAELGVTDVGENRAQEGERKRVECGPLPLTWHHVGQLQTNKAAAVARYADVVHSVDRLELIQALGRAVRDRPAPLRCLVQLRVDPPEAPAAPGRGGAAPEDLLTLADAVAATPGLTLAGVMAVAPRAGDPAAAFAALARYAERLREAHPAAVDISAGMSGDLEAAIAHGATLVRVGSAILGTRALAG